MHNHEAIFAAAWNRDGNTSIELDPLDVNQVIASEYDGVEGLTLTRTQLWEMEVKKAARPDLFIPGVIRAGTARSWGRRQLDSGDEVFIRVSEQRLWLQPDSYGTVIEACYLNHSSQQVTFIGLAEVEDDSGQTITASPKQPLFHVVHGVSGTEEVPLNTWRIVVALHWRQILDANPVLRAKDLAENEGLKRARVDQILRLTKLDSDVLEALQDMPKEQLNKEFSEPKLRKLVPLSHEEQIKVFSKMCQSH